MLNPWLSAHIFLIVSYALAIVGVAHMLRHRRSPGSTMAWLVTFILLPLVGTVLYLMFGGRKLRMQKRTPPRIAFESTQTLSEEAAHAFADTLLRYGAAPVAVGNQVTLCKDGAAGYQTLVELIEQARNRICLMTFIFAHDAVGRDILRKLSDKARAGVEVKVLVDGLGSMKTPRRCFRELVKAGGQFAVFQPVVHLPFRTRTNLRNHRKILIADGSRSFAGGMNITCEDLYVEGTQGGWRDVSLALDGPAVQHLEAVFWEDWQFATRDTGGRAWGSESLPQAGSEVVQVLASGPDVPHDPMYSASLAAIYRASRRI